MVLCISGNIQVRYVSSIVIQLNWVACDVSFIPKYAYRCHNVIKIFIPSSHIMNLCR